MPLRRSSWCRRPYSGCTWSRGRSGATSRRRSNAASSTLRTVAQSSPAVAARPTYLVTTPLEIPSAAAICWCDILASSFKRNTSFILRILILGTGTLSPDKCWERTRSVAICVTSFRCCTTPFRYRDRRFRHRDRRFRWRPKSVTIDRNGWSRWTGMTGHDRPESLVTIDRNTHRDIVQRRDEHDVVLVAVFVDTVANVADTRTVLQGKVVDVIVGDEQAWLLSEQIVDGLVQRVARAQPTGIACVFRPRATAEIVNADLSVLEVVVASRQLKFFVQVLRECNIVMRPNLVHHRVFDVRAHNAAAVPAAECGGLQDRMHNQLVLLRITKHPLRLVQVIDAVTVQHGLHKLDQCRVGDRKSVV